MSDDATYRTPTHFTSDGNLVSESNRGGYINFPDGAGLQVAGNDRTQVLDKAVASVAAGVRLAGGVVTLGGANPTVITTGLATVTSVQVTLLSVTSPGLDPGDFTADFANALGNNVTPGVVNLYAWKYTSNANPTLIPSTNNTAKVAWIAIGT